MMRVTRVLAAVHAGDAIIWRLCSNILSIRCVCEICFVLSGRYIGKAPISTYGVSRRHIYGFRSIQQKTEQMKLIFGQRMHDMT